jgi:hypothetical protein
MTPLLWMWLLAATPPGAMARPQAPAPAVPPAAEMCQPAAKEKSTGRALLEGATTGSCGAEPPDRERMMPPPFRWEVPGLLAWVDSDGPMRANGVPVLLQLARSSRSVEDLGRHFANAFTRAGLFIPPPKERVALTREPQLTALDPMRMLSYTVILQANPDKTTTVVLGTANVGAWNPPAQSQTLGWAPLMPGAAHLLRTEAEGHATASYQVTGTPETVRAFYREALAKGGYVPVPEAEDLYRREGESLQVRARKDEQTPSLVLVWLTRRQGYTGLEAP